MFFKADLRVSMQSKSKTDDNSALFDDISGKENQNATKLISDSEFL